MIGRKDQGGEGHGKKHFLMPEDQMLLTSQVFRGRGIFIKYNSDDALKSFMVAETDT